MKYIKYCYHIKKLFNLLYVYSYINQKTQQMKNSVKITVNQLIEKLATWNKGAQPASIQYVTEPDLTKEGKQRFGNITKIANIGAMIGYSYENSVNNQREREEKLTNFMAEPLWKGAGMRISTALAMHKTTKKFYLSYKKQQTFRSFHFDQALNFIPSKILAPFFKSQGSYDKQGVDKPVYHREISIENVKRLKFGGVTYEIV
jgi:hypothetical protein